MVGRSTCFSCGKRLSWYELVPIISYLALKGKCSSCKSRVSIQYPIVEFVTGLLFVGVFFHLGIFVSALVSILHLIIMSLLVIMAVYDIRHSIIPDLMVYIFTFLSFLLLFVDRSWNVVYHHPYELLFAGIILAIPFATISLLSRGTWMGWGDSKLALGIGWFLGLSAGISAVMYAFWIGAIVALGMKAYGKTIRGKKLTMKTEIPFAPFLILGLLIVYIFDLNIINPDALIVFSQV